MLLLCLKKAKYNKPESKRSTVSAGQWWHTPLILALGSRGIRIAEFEASLVYEVNSRTVMDTQKNSVSKKKKNCSVWQ